MQSESTITFNLDTTEVRMFLDLIENVLRALPQPEWRSSQEGAREEAVKRLKEMRAHFDKKGEIDQYRTPKTKKKIIINGVEHFTEKPRLTYYDIALLAENTDRSDLTVMFYRPEGGNGILFWYETVGVSDGMVIIACWTGNA